jgi:hypothetical protein
MVLTRATAAKKEAHPCEGMGLKLTGSQPVGEV